MAFRDDIKRTIATVLYPGYVKNPETDLCMVRRFYGRVHIKNEFCGIV